MRSRQITRTILLLIFSCCILCTDSLATGPDRIRTAIVATPTDGGIREEVPNKFRERFDRWKAELLSTDIGREQWDRYANNKQFVLTIKVTGSKGEGAATDDFKWDSDGRFVGATISLGSGIADGYPGPVYYPVLNSLSEEHAAIPISGNILAATKISHEMGHVLQAETASLEELRTQADLIPKYTSIFLANGYNTKDARLVTLAEKIGGTPMEIWESREYWSEVNAMRFLQEKIRGESFYCRVFDRIRQNVDTFARSYSKRFEPADAPCGK